MRLEPNAGTCTHDRAGFLMHGDSVQHPGGASKGCVIMARAVRQSVWGMEIGNSECMNRAY